MTSSGKTSRRAALRGGLILVLACLPAILSLRLVVPAMPGAPTAAVLLQPAVLLILAAFAGSLLAARAGLRLVAPLPVGARAGQVATGVVLGAAIAAADHALRDLWQPAARLPPSIVEAWNPAGLVVGLLYGGMVEEVMFRWFAMSLLAVVLHWSVARRSARTRRWIMPAAAIGAAALFAASHLPALAMAGPLPGGGAVLRTLLLNGVAGLIFGLLFARRDLVAAMLAHASTHLGFAAAALAVEMRA